MTDVLVVAGFAFIFGAIVGAVAGGLAGAYAALRYMEKFYFLTSGE